VEKERKNEREPGRPLELWGQRRMNRKTKACIACNMGKMGGRDHKEAASRSGIFVQGRFEE